MEHTKIIRIVCNHNEEIDKLIQKFCGIIANDKDCIELDVREDGINRTEYKFRGEEDDEVIDDKQKLLDEMNKIARGLI